MFENPNFDTSKHLRDKYNLGEAPEWMRKIGMIGKEFSLSFKNIKIHKGKDNDHALTKDEWLKLPQAIKKPFAITRYKNAKDRFRLYVNIVHEGKFVAVGVDVKKINQGKNLPMLEINAIKTVFAHNGSIPITESVIAYDKNITPEQKALLRGLNFHEYPTIQELSTDKGSEENSDTQENSAKAQYSLQGNSMTEEEQRIADEAKANGTFDASNPDIRYSLATDLNAEVSEGEANPIAEKEVVNVIVDSSEIKLPTNRAEALDVVSKMKRPFINHDQNKEIIVSNKAVRHAATQDKMHKFVDVRCLGVIDKIIENAVKIGNIDVAPDEIETTHKVEVYYCPVKIDDTQYSVRILVRQLKNKGRIMEDFRMYDLAAKDKKSDVSSQGTGNESLTPLLTSDFAYKVKDLIHNSKEQDKKLLGISNKTKFSLQGGRSIADKYEKRVNTKGKGGAMHLSKFNFMEAWQD